MTWKRVLLVLLLGVPPAAWADAPRPLSGRGLENLTAYARLLSLVRFFHPSDEGAAADWNRVAVAGVDAVEGAADPAALSRALEDFFRPLAPTLRVFTPDGRPAVPVELRPPAGDSKVVAWRHYGGKFAAKTEVFRSERIDDRSPSFATLVQAVAPGPLAGRRVKLRAAVRAEVEEGGSAQLGLRVDLPGGKTGFFDNMADRPIRDKGWKVYEIEGDVAPDAERIVVALVLTGGGKVWLDEVSLSGGRGTPLANPGFDEGEEGRQPPGWYFPYESIRAGYHLTLRQGEACRRGGCAEVAADPLATPHIPQPAEVLEVDLGAGVVAALPVALYADARGTLPPASAAAAPWAAVDADAAGRSARLAAVALAWGALQHLHPELDRTAAAWSAALPAALTTAATDPDPEAFSRTLARLAVPLGDPRTMGDLDDPSLRTPPVAWEWIEDRLVVTEVAAGASGVRVGDVVAALDGRPVAEALAEAEALISAATAESRRWLALRRLALGAAGSRVVLQIERPGAAPSEVILVRETTAGALLGTPLPPEAEPRSGVLYVDLRRISEERFLALLPRLASARGVILDLRGDSNVSNVLLSHLTDRSAMSSSWQVPVLLRPDYQGAEFLTTFWTIEPKAPRLRGRVAVLTDGRAFGYSETLLAMIEQYRWGEIVGARSGACNGSVNWIRLPGRQGIAWTGQRVLKHDGTPLYGVGVQPTVPMVRTLRGVAEGRDEIVEKAVEVVTR